MDKKSNKNMKDQINSFMPDKASDDPNTILKSDKKLYSIIFIVIVSLALAANLISIIIGFSSKDLVKGFTALFVGTINTVIVLLLVVLLISLSHNVSRMTRATLFMCNKLMKDEKRLALKEQQEKAEAELAEAAAKPQTEAVKPQLEEEKPQEKVEAESAEEVEEAPAEIVEELEQTKEAID